MEFNYILSILNNEIHPIPDKHKLEIELVKKILMDGQGYLTKRTKTEPYTRVVFYKEA